MGKMITRSVHYKRINNLGNYSSEHMEMTAELEPGDNEEQCGRELKAKILAALGINDPEPVEKSEPKPKPQPTPKPVAADTDTNNNFDENPW